MKNKIIKIKLTSENISWGPEPAYTNEVYQVLTIFKDGKINFRSYQYEKHKLLRSKNLKVSPKRTEEILYQIEKIIDQPSYTPCFATDVGDWTLEVFYTTKARKKFTGSLFNNNEFQQISDELRRLSQIQNLFAFDGN